MSLLMSVIVTAVLCGALQAACILAVDVLTPRPGEDNLR